MKKQGILPAVFENPDDYYKIDEDSVIDTIGLSGLMPSTRISLKVYNMETEKSTLIPLKHTMSEDQIQWFKAGSALNMIAKK